MRLIILLILIILILGVFYWYNYGKMTYIKSPIDNNFYMVRDLPDKYTAVNLLATMRLNILKLKDHLNSKKNTDYKEYKQYIEQLSNRIHDVTISESRGNEDVKDENGEHKEVVTSYSVNKGEELYLCIRSKNTNKIHDINDLLYVALHEVAHIGCPEIGHTDLFFKINLYLLKKAVEFNLYKYDNYNNKPREYCGINLNNTLLN